jgi:hypothetical protein
MGRKKPVHRRDDDFMTEDVWAEMAAKYFRNFAFRQINTKSF